jgi:2-methylcitrate dehydratase PrpD
LKKRSENGYFKDFRQKKGFPHMKKHATGILAAFVSGLKYEQLPMKTISKAKDVTLDYIGALLAAYPNGNTLSNQLVALLMRNGGAAQASIIRQREKVPVLSAALANGTLSHVTELDDGHRIACGHPGVAVLSAALPMAEFLKSSGKSFITAIVAGYEVFVRLASAINPAHLNRGFHTTGTCGTFAAAAAAASLLMLDETQTANALGLAGIQAAGLLEVTVDGQMAKALHAGKAAYNGILAALLAKEGAEGPKSVIEGVKGFVKTMSDNCDYSMLLDDLGHEYGMDSCYIKLYPSCRHTHPPTDAMLDFVQANLFNWRDVKEIKIKTFPAAISFAGHIFQPKTAAEAKFSIAYCVCAALYFGNLGLRELEFDCLNNPDVVLLTKKVRIEPDESLESMIPKAKGAEIHVTLQDGRQFQKRIHLPKGESETPVSFDALKRKFVGCAGYCFRNEEIDGITDLISSLETLHDIQDLVLMLKPA